MKKLLAFALLSACTTVDVVDTDPPHAPAEQYRWTVYTHASCDGARVDGSQVLVTGDFDSHDADNYAALWKGACMASEGLIGTPLEGHLCVLADDTPAPWGCDATVEFSGAFVPTTN